jgi:hypothetical protein
VSKPTTLADKVYLATTSDAFLIHRRKELQQKILRAQRFVLDTDMSIFLADLCVAGFLNKPVRVLTRLVEQMRMAARLPFQTTWIEYDVNAFNLRIGELIDIDPPKDTTIQGWLLESNQDVNTAHIFSPSPVKYNLGITALVYHWCNDNQILLVPNSLRIKLFDPVAHCVGWFGYLSQQVDVSYTPYGGFRELEQAAPSEFIQKMNVLLENHVGVLHIIWSLLATMGDLPIVKREVCASRGFIAPHGGGYKHYLNFRTITLNIPSDKEPHKVARNIVAKVRRGMPLHKVRAHWHGHPKFMPRISCEHKWDYADDLRICVICEGIQWRVGEYEQGYAEFGIIYHDYEVKHPS